MVQTWINGIDTQGIHMGHGKDLNSPMVPMVLTQTQGIVSVLLNHTYTREQSVTRMQFFLIAAF